MTDTVEPDDTIHAHDSDEDLDGCNLDISEADATPDEDLPAADGGVE